MIRKTVALLALSFCAASAHAQLAAYGMVTVARLTGIAGSPNAAPFAAGSLNDNVNPIGGTFGVYYDFKTLGPFRLGIDARGSIMKTERGAEKSSNGGGTRINSGLGGVRGSFHTPVKFIEGYVQASAGIARTNYGLLLPSQLQSGFEYHAFAGLQLHVTPYADFRAFEVGYGGIDGGGHNYPLKSISTGVVFHFPTVR